MIGYELRRSNNHLLILFAIAELNKECQVARGRCIWAQDPTEFREGRCRDPCPLCKMVIGYDGRMRSPR
jgi:hypothetical protein